MPNREFSSIRHDFARCRVLRHAWEVTGENEAGGSKLIVLRCDCGTVRYDRWNTRTGARWGKPTYIYPLGYKDLEPGHDLEFWRKEYAEYLYSKGILGEPPAADTRRRKKPA